MQRRTDRTCRPIAVRDRPALGTARSRRGSALVLIVGTLALIAVITVAYVAIGRSDRRSAAALVRDAGIERTVTRIADYIANDVIAADVFSVYVLGEDNAGNPVFGRAAWDYPYTSYSTSSSAIAGGGLGTAGATTRFNPVGTIPDNWQPGDPPVEAADPWLAALEPVWLDSTGQMTPTDPARPYLDLRDWAHISNISPDGRFVNLWNLAPLVNGRRVPNFDAEPGKGLDSDGLPRLSQDLFLFDASGNRVTVTDFGTTADPDRPAHWDSRLRGAFRPIRDTELSPADPFYLPYQFADADGDGMIDSRWQELVDAADPDNVSAVLPRDDRFRWFIAARVVDLSGLVNVNTATDFAAAPDNTFRAGLTPADIDLARLLLLEDDYWLLGEGYDALAQPMSLGAIPEAEGDYSDYDNAARAAIGDEAYRHLRYALATAKLLAVGEPVPPDPFVQLDAGERFEHYYDRGAYGLSAGFFSPTDRYHFGALFGLADLLELVTYRATNLPTLTSRLEAALDGRAWPDWPYFGPLRSNRPLEVERGTIDRDAGGAGDGVADDDAMLRFAIDPRQRLTTISGARPLRSGRVELFGPGGFDLTLSHDLTATDFRIDARSALDRAINQTQRDPRLLLAGYAEALLPYSDEPGAWDLTSPRATLNYGHSAELALRLAAHMTANAIDAYDVDNTPSPFTLLVDGSFDPASDPVAFPWWNNGEQGRLDLDDALSALGLLGPASRLWNPSTGDPEPQSRAINVFGIEAQPFLTQAATFTMYADAPMSAGGDMDWNDDPGAPGIPDLGQVAFPPITIDGTVSNTNADFLMQVFAVQLTNPFDEPIDLGPYFIEFGGGSGAGTTTFKYDISGTLSPGATRVFYVLSDSESAIEAKWQQIDGSVPVGAVEAWLTAQLGPAERRQEMFRFDPDTGATLPWEDVLAGSAGADDSRNRVVKLWRTPGNPTGLGGDDDDEPGFGGPDYSSAILIDRLRDPQSGRPTLDRRLSAGRNDIAGTQGGDETGADPRDNLDAFSITLWGAIRRPDDPGEGGTTGVPRGGIPAYCLEVKYLADPALGRPVNLEETDNVDLPPDCGDFANAPSGCSGGVGFGFGGGPAGRADLASLLADQSASPLSMTLPEQVDQAGSATILSNLDPVPKPYGDLYPEIHLNNKAASTTVATPIGTRTISTLRLTDLLLPMALGPTHDPFDPLFLLTGDPDDQWLTLPEALALALHYDATSPDPGSGLSTQLSAHVLDQINEKLDRGSLRLGVADPDAGPVDAFVPFVDVDLDGQFTPGLDEMRGPGVPLGARVLEVFSTLDPLFGSITRPAQGLINVNTAPLAVLRTLPMLSPSTGVDPSTGQPRWWWFGTEHDTGSDIAATVQAYRDKLALWPRGSDEPVNFRPDKIGAIDFGDPANPYDTTSRALSAGVTALREQPGFASLGELLMVRDLQYTPSAGIGGSGYLRPHDIDRLGFDNKPSDRSGVDSTRYGTAAEDDQLADDYDEQLAIMAALGNVATVRSDYFGVWFVLHGYQPSDLEGLEPDDPLVPSVARRYFMVVDRSTVLRKGDRARIVLLQELPMP